MICYAIKSNEEYIADVPKAITQAWRGCSLKVTDSDDEAKHYKEDKKPANWIKTTIKRIKGKKKTKQQRLLQLIHEEKEEAKNDPNGYRYRSYSWKKNDCQIVYRLLTDRKSNV